MKYPTTPPKPKTRCKLAQNILIWFDHQARAVSVINQGYWENEASAKAIPPKAFTLFGLFARDKTQLYILRI